MIKLLKRMTKREYGMVCASLVFIVAQVWLDLTALSGVKIDAYAKGKIVLVTECGVLCRLNKK